MATIDCFYWSKIQNLKANHNRYLWQNSKARIAFTGQRYKIWKQITTYCVYRDANARLLLLVKDTKFESKSQPDEGKALKHGDCFYWSKIQNLKANHNIERDGILLKPIAFTGQRYKIWKQITTEYPFICSVHILLLLVKDTKFESKSQLCPHSPRRQQYCFYWSKIQNLKANHNELCCTCYGITIAFTGQRYKIWKQITTGLCRCSHTCKLLLLVKDTKFESKSQREWRLLIGTIYCFYWSKIQNLKANHNRRCSSHLRWWIAFTGQRYKIWKQITTGRLRCLVRPLLLLLVKDTKFESKSQLTTTAESVRVDCFYWSKIQNLKANHNS